MLTGRGRCMLGLGLGVYLAAWAFGSKPLYPVATGLLLVVALAWAWVRLSNRPFRVRRGWGDTGTGGGAASPWVAGVGRHRARGGRRRPRRGRARRLGERPARCGDSRRTGRPAWRAETRASSQRPPPGRALRPRAAAAGPLCVRRRPRRDCGSVRARERCRAAACSRRITRLPTIGEARAALLGDRRSLTRRPALVAPAPQRL